MKKFFLKKWNETGGCREVLILALPLIISIGAGTVQMFFDRIFLNWYSDDAMAGAMQAGIASFSIASFFLGTVSYVNTFVAQYFGAQKNHRVGPVIWQGVFLVAVSGLLMLLLIPFASRIFKFFGHEQAIQQAEITYFQIMCITATPMLLDSVLAAFFTGRGDTKTVMFVNLAATGVDLVLDYLMIFGKLGFPRMGVAGAAWSNCIAAVFIVVVYFVLILNKHNRKTYHMIKGFGFDRDLIKRILKFGLPNGVQFMLDVSAFTIFIMFVGRISETAQKATAIAFSINTLAFMPMIGIGIAVTTLVGQALGRNEPDVAQRSTWSGFYVAFAYMVTMAISFWLLPGLFLLPFSVNADPARFALIRPVAVNLLLFVAFYCLFDAGNIIFAAALKGAGDTRFVMIFTILLSWLVMVLPSYLDVRLGGGVYAVWTFTTAYVCIIAIVFLLRFLSGKWKSMRVIEHAAPSIPPNIPAPPEGL